MPREKKRNPDGLIKKMIDKYRYLFQDKHEEAFKDLIMYGEASIYFEDTEINAGAIPKGFAQ